MGSIEINRIPKGIIKIPPSKSIAHRAIICAGLCRNDKSIIENISDSEDITATLNCMKALKAGIETLDCGESGSTLRFLIPIAAAVTGEAVFCGRGRLMERPLTPYIEELDKKGVKIVGTNSSLKLKGRLQPGKFTLSGDISSQFVSGLLFALPLLNGDSEIEIITPLQSAPYVDLTVDVMKKFGVSVKTEGCKKFYIKGGQNYKPCSFHVEGDYSQAAFFLVAGALGAKCECVGLDKESLQGDKKIIDILERCGAKITETANGGITAAAEYLKPVTVDVSDIPDLVPPLAALFSFCNGVSHIENAGRLRYKESDRLSAVTQQLNAIGCDVFEGNDKLTIIGKKSITGGRAESQNDHRIAMAVAVASIKSKNPVFLWDYECVKKSYPGFWQDFLGEGMKL